VRRLDPALAEAAAVDGASPAQTWRRILGPVLAPHALAAALVTFALAMGEIETVRHVIPPNRTLMAALVFDQAHRNLEHDLAGLCLVQWTVIAVAGAAALLVARRSRLTSSRPP
jgi:ABC-type spermidine/putrescine transport system permease subunit I